MPSTLDIPVFTIIAVGSPVSEGCRAFGSFPVPLSEDIRLPLSEHQSLSVDDPTTVSRTQFAYYVGRHLLYVIPPIPALENESLHLSIIDMESDCIRSGGDLSSPILLFLWTPTAKPVAGLLSAFSAQFPLSALELPFSFGASGDIDEAPAELYPRALAYLEAAMLSSAPAFSPASARSRPSL